MMKVQWQRTLVLSGSTPKEFMHLQQNQTGSDSIDRLISCALDRQQGIQEELGGDPIVIGAISEGGDGVEMCMNELASRLSATLMDGKFYRNDKADCHKHAPCAHTWDECRLNPKNQRKPNAESHFQNDDESNDSRRSSSVR